MNEGDSQLHTLSVLEELREASKGLWGASSEAYFRVDELLWQHPASPRETCYGNRKAICLHWQGLASEQGINRLGRSRSLSRNFEPKSRPPAVANEESRSTPPAQSIHPSLDRDVIFYGKFS